MRKILALFFILHSSFCIAQIAVQYSPVDFTHYSPGAVQMGMTPLWNYASDGVTNLVHGGDRKFSTGTIIDGTGRTLAGIPGTLIVSNVFAASGGSAYRLDVFLQGNPHPVATWTNVFTNGTPAFVNGGTGYFGVSTNSTMGDQYAYTINQVDALIAAIPGGGGGNGISFLQATQVVDGSGGVISTNGSHTTFKFSTTGSNVISSLATTVVTADTNAMGIANSALSAFRNTNTFVPQDQDGGATISGLMTASGFQGDGSLLTAINGSQITSGTVPPAQLGSGASITTKFLRGDSTWQPVSGAGTVTSVDVAIQGMSSSGAITTSGTVTLTQNADKNHLGFSETNINKLAATNSAIIGGPFIDATNVLQVNTLGGARKFMVNTNGDTFINGAFYLNGVPLLDASALKANQFVRTDGSTNLTSTLDLSLGTNSVTWAHEGTATNITATFNGTLQTFTVTNGPTVFLSYAGANGSVSYRIISTNFTTLQFSYQPKWLAGSNSVITNGVLSLTSYGGTNSTQIEAAMRENQ